MNFWRVVTLIQAVVFHLLRSSSVSGVNLVKVVACSSLCLLKASCYLQGRRRISILVTGLVLASTGCRATHVCVICPQIFPVLPESIKKFKGIKVCPTSTLLSMIVKSAIVRNLNILRQKNCKYGRCCRSAVNVNQMANMCKYTTVVLSSPLSRLEGRVNMDAVYLPLFVFGLERQGLKHRSDWRALVWAPSQMSAEQRQTCE